MRGAQVTLAGARTVIFDFLTVLPFFCLLLPRLRCKMKPRAGNGAVRRGQLVGSPQRKGHVMTRMFACFILGLTMVLGSNLRADDKSSAPKAPAEKKDAPGKPKKRETVFGTVKHFDAEKGVVTLELQRRKNAPGGEKEFKLPKGITVTVFENGKLKDV